MKFNNFNHAVEKQKKKIEQTKKIEKGKNLINPNKLKSKNLNLNQIFMYSIFFVRLENLILKFWMHFRSTTRLKNLLVYPSNAIGI